MAVTQVTAAGFSDHPNKQGSAYVSIASPYYAQREAGRIRFSRIGTRVLYCADQFTEFLKAFERNGHKRKSKGIRFAALWKPAARVVELLNRS